jgi:hypothetical protein
MKKTMVLVAAIVAGVGIAATAAAQVRTWWAPAGGPCPTYPDKASCEKGEGKACTQRSGTASPAC